MEFQPICIPRISIVAFCSTMFTAWIAADCARWMLSLPTTQARTTMETTDRLWSLILGVVLSDEMAASKWTLLEIYRTNPWLWSFSWWVSPAGSSRNIALVNPAFKKIFSKSKLLWFSPGRHRWVLTGSLCKKSVSYLTARHGITFHYYIPFTASKASMNKW